MKKCPDNLGELTTMQYDNFSDFLHELDWKMLSTREEFYKNNSFKYICNNQHQLENSRASFINKKCTYIKTGESLCKFCKKLDNLENKRKQLELLIKDTGHKILVLNADKSLIYICGKCGKQSNSYSHNIVKSEGRCSNCHHEDSKIPQDEVKKRVEEKGMILEQYINNKNVLVTCVCGKTGYKTTMIDISRGKQCAENCKVKKYIETCVQKYNVTNTSKLQETKDKTIETNMSKWGVPHHSQDPTIHEKTKATNMKNLGVPYAFNQEWVYLLIREIHTKNHGYPFPLMSQKIQKKCQDTCKEHWGAIYPFLSPKFIIKFKSEMRDKYGAEYFVISDTFKEIMINKYGAASAMQCPELFRKAMKSMFTTKKYTLKNGRIINLMGYEHFCVRDLTFKGNSILGRLVEDDEILAEDDVPHFKYFDEVGKERTYYPDLHIKNTKIIIEVKSIYTFNLEPKRNHRKFQTVADQGYIMQVFIYGRSTLFDEWIFEKNKPTISNKWKTFDSKIPK